MKDQIEEEELLDEAEDMAEDETEVLDEAEDEDEGEDASNEEGEADEGAEAGDDEDVTDDVSEADKPDEDDDAFRVEIGEDEDEGETSSIRELRARNRELKAQLRKFEEGKDGGVEALGPKPTIEDFDYDEERFTEALLAWGEKKREFDAREQEQREKDEALKKRFHERKAHYDEAKVSLGAKDFDSAEDAVCDVLSIPQQNFIIANVENPALFVYALGKNEKHLQALAAETDPASFIYKLAKLETKMEVTDVKTKPKPERRPNGKSAAPMSGEKKLERLRAEAAKTGDFSKVHAFKKQLKANA
jgi:hypothetical protein